MSGNTQANFKRTPVPVFVTLPDHILRHEISDEELDMMCQNRKDRMVEIVWCSIGAISGAAPGTVSALWKMIVLKSTAPMEISDLTQVVLFFAGLCVASAMGFVANVRGSSTVDIATKIRERTNRRAS